jgi:hypothetical protein
LKKSKSQPVGGVSATRFPVCSSSRTPEPDPSSMNTLRRFASTPSTPLGATTCHLGCSTTIAGRCGLCLTTFACATTPKVIETTSARNTATNRALVDTQDKTAPSDESSDLSASMRESHAPPRARHRTTASRSFRPSRQRGVGLGFRALRVGRSIGRGSPRGAKGGLPARRWSLRQSLGMARSRGEYAARGRRTGPRTMVFTARSAGDTSRLGGLTRIG